MDRRQCDKIDDLLRNGRLTFRNSFYFGGTGIRKWAEAAYEPMYKDLSSRNFMLDDGWITCHDPFIEQRICDFLFPWRGSSS